MTIPIWREWDLKQKSRLDCEKIIYNDSTICTFVSHSRAQFPYSYHSSPYEVHNEIIFNLNKRQEVRGLFREECHTNFKRHMEKKSKVFATGLKRLICWGQMLDYPPESVTFSFLRQNLTIGFSNVRSVGRSIGEPSVLRWFIRWMIVFCPIDERINVEVRKISRSQHWMISVGGVSWCVMMHDAFCRIGLSEFHFSREAIH